MSYTQHNEWADSMADWAVAHNEDYTAADRHEHAFVQPQVRPYIPAGVTQQGRIQPTIVPAEACTEIGADDSEPLTRGESLRFWIVTSAISFAGYALLVWWFKP